MKASKLIIWAGADSLGAFLYVLGASWVISHGNELFGAMKSFWAPAAFLLFFVFSATVEGALVLGWPAYLFLTDRKKEAIKLLILTIVFLGVITAGVFVFLLTTKA
jgi:hypothetical protein